MSRLGIAYRAIVGFISYRLSKPKRSRNSSGAVKQTSISEVMASSYPHLLYKPIESQSRRVEGDLQKSVVSCVQLSTGPHLRQKSL